MPENHASEHQVLEKPAENAMNGLPEPCIDAPSTSSNAPTTSELPTKDSTSHMNVNTLVMAEEQNLGKENQIPMQTKYVNLKVYEQLVSVLNF